MEIRKAYKINKSTSTTSAVLSTPHSRYDECESQEFYRRYREPDRWKSPLYLSSGDNISAEGTMKRNRSSFILCSYRDEILQCFDIGFLRVVHLHGDGFAFGLERRRLADGMSAKEWTCCQRHSC